ncbi:MAG: ATP-binding protein [Candidatus Riflebacteria bacterium]|nr:ATP-binding protein [Candidatus Riflebacteria bacterium]
MLERSLTSKVCRAQVETLRNKSGCDFQALERIALALGLQEDPRTLQARPDDKGGRAFEYEHIDHFGTHGEVFRSVISVLNNQVMQGSGLMEFVRKAINAGMERLAAAFEACHQDWEMTLRRLDPIEGFGKSARLLASATVTPIDIWVGTDGQGRPIVWAFNREGGDQTNGNTAIMGVPGMGKTQFLQSLLSQIAVQGSETGFLALDYKGDLGKDERFVKRTGARIIRPEECPVPLNPLAIPERVPARLVPEAFAEVFKSFRPGLGEVQKNALANAYRDLLDAGAEPTFTALHDRLKAIYEENSRSEDTATGLVRQLASLQLFAEKATLSPSELLGQRIILDLSRLESVRELVAFLVLHAFQMAVSCLPDAPIEAQDERRALRCVVAIDEAHHYLRRKSPPLLTLVREGRSRGVAVMLASQSPEDFRGQPEYEELLGNAFLFRLGQPPSNRSLAGVLHESQRTAKQLADVVVGLRQYEVVSTLRTGENNRHSRLKILPFWQLAEEAGGKGPGR